MKFIIVLALASLGATLILTPIFKKIALKFGFISESNHRTMHTHPIPYLGGISIYLGMIIGLFNIIIFIPHKINSINHLIGYLLGGTFIMMTGLYDDIKGTNCNQKLLLQIVAAIIIVMFDFKLNLLSNIFGTSAEIEILDKLLTVIWIIGITNAFNLIDGLDGLASGISIICLITFIILAWGMGNETVILLSTILIGSTLGFLKYNFNPAKIFMGDAGSLFLGFTLACISIKGFFTTTENIYSLIPLFAFGIPIIDTSLAILRRTKRRIHPFKADKEHIHHQLIKLGFSHRNAVLLLFGISFIFGLIAYAIYFIDLKLIIFLVTVVLIFCLWGIKVLGYFGENKKREINRKIENNQTSIFPAKIVNHKEIQNE